ncbi:MAG: hypothetical protein EOP11_01700 [Proteobacteria bacterium]|nr:MAG: hypothetical protein EOP11_01700 [Pseudomonadota bacterium]
METATTQRANGQSEADRAAQEQSRNLRELRKKQSEELQSARDNHERAMKQAESAYKVEFSGKTSEYSRKLNELNERQQGQLATLEKTNDQNLKQVSDTYRSQAAELRSQGERKLATIREQTSESEQNITRRVTT